MDYSESHERYRALKEQQDRLRAERDVLCGLLGEVLAPRLPPGV